MVDVVGGDGKSGRNSLNHADERLTMRFTCCKIADQSGLLWFFWILNVFALNKAKIEPIINSATTNVVAYLIVVLNAETQSPRRNAEKYQELWTLCVLRVSAMKDFCQRRTRPK